MLSASGDKRLEYISHNFDVLNRHLNELFLRNRVITSTRKAEVFKTYAKYGALLSIGVGFGLLLLFWGLAKIVNPRPEIIERPVIIEKPISFQPQIILPSGENTEIKNLRESAAARTRTLTEDADRKGDNKSVSPVFNYVIFVDIPFVRDGFKVVVMGMRYPNSEATEPSKQWCYIERSQGDGTVRTASLSKKEGSSKIDDPITRQTAIALNTTVDALQEAQTRCVFR